MIDQDHRGQRFTRLCDHVVDVCGQAGYVAPPAWVRWLVDLELEAVASRHGLSVRDAAEAMSMEDAAQMAHQLVEITRDGDPGGY